MKKLATMMAMMAVMAVMTIPAFADPYIGGSYISIENQGYAQLGAAGGEGEIYGNILIQGETETPTGITAAGVGATFDGVVFANGSGDGGPISVAGTNISSYGNATVEQGPNYGAVNVSAGGNVTSITMGSDGYASGTLNTGAGGLSLGVTGLFLQ